MSREPEERRIVFALEKRMLRKLRKNAHKPHWATESLDYLLKRLEEEVQELRDACVQGTADEIGDEAADVANIVAMITDVTKGRTE